MNATWSEKIAARYRLRLPADLVAWFDGEIWKDPGGAEFCEPVTPEQLLEPEPGSVWGGFMLPDTLPIIGNRYGDWLCLRIDRNGGVVEVLYWGHGGGDWIPYGKSLPEALIYDAAHELLYPKKPEWQGEPERSEEQRFRAANWACGQLRRQGVYIPRFWESQQFDPLETLREVGVAQFVARRDLLLRRLDSELKQQSDAALAGELGVDWEPDFVRWLFDTELTPHSTRAALAKRLNTSERRLLAQDWASAEQEALRVCELRSDLSWAYDVAGWAAQRRGDASLAARRYLQGLRCSLFSDDTVRFRTHWCEDGYGKFSAARLAELRDELPAEALKDPYLQLFLDNEPQTLSDRVCQYWLDKADEAQSKGRFDSAYEKFSSAGWDLGLRSVTQYEAIMESLIDSAEKAEFTSLAEVARLHRKFI